MEKKKIKNDKRQVIYSPLLVQTNVILREIIAIFRRGKNEAAEEEQENRVVEKN